ncbi:MAG: hypothetical protein IV090_08925 [Candidatus Sericytochromatia bacterium]|nr:hypothetical protein [Candidatus Sericytochromatia bacterium]
MPHDFSETTDIHSRFSFEPEFESQFESRPKGELLQKLGHQLLQMGVHELTREYFKMAQQVHPNLGKNLLEEALQLNLAFLDEPRPGAQHRKRQQYP